MPTRIKIRMRPKPFLSLSKPELVNLKYTGKDGCYVSVTPDADSMQKILNVALALRLETDSLKIHATVMYCKDTGLPSKIDAPDATEFYAYSNEIKHWSGHDDKTYIVIALSSPNLMIENARLCGYGMRNSFPVYSPHVTLTSDVTVTPKVQKLIDKMNYGLAVNPLKLIFNNWTLSSIKSD